MGIKYECIEFSTVKELIEYQTERMDLTIFRKLGEEIEKAELRTKPKQEKVKKAYRLKINVQGTPWTEKELDFIIEFYKRNTRGRMLKRGKMKEIATTLGRTEAAVSQAARILREQGKISTAVPELKVSKSYKKKNVSAPQQKKKKRKTMKQNKRFTPKEDQEIERVYKKFKVDKNKQRISPKKLRVLAKRIGRMPGPVMSRARKLGM